MAGRNSKAPVTRSKTEATNCKTPALKGKTEVTKSKSPAPKAIKEVTKSKSPVSQTKKEVTKFKTPVSKTKKEVTKSKSPASKSKAKNAKKEIKIAPRLRLEPRLSSSPLKKGKNYQNHGSGESSSLDARDLSNIPVLDTNARDSDTEERFEPRDELPNTKNLSAAEGIKSHRAGSNAIEATEDEEGVEKQFQIKGKPVKKRKYGDRMYKGQEWSDRERMDLTVALQVHGFSDIKKLAECVKTKKESDIDLYMKRRRIEASYNPGEKKINRQGNKFNTLHRHHLASWPNIRKWRRLAYSQMMVYARTKDYSKPVLTSLCRKFYEEEKEPTDPQVINTKLIYKYMMCCMEGEVPPQLPPKESALVLDMLREVRSMPIAYDFEEERKFLQGFKTATKFRPFQIKDEFKKKIKTESQEEDMFPANAVKVPEEVFMELSRHKRLTQSFSPMVTPVWMLQKEQEMLAKYAAESNVYVD